MNLANGPTLMMVRIASLDWSNYEYALGAPGEMYGIIMGRL